MITVKHDLDKLKKELNHIEKKQIPFAASKAINETAKRVRNAYRAQSVKYLDRPTRTTVSGMFVEWSKKTQLWATVGLKPHVSKYLDKQISGGVGRSTAVPVNINLNAYGNIPGRRAGKIRNLPSQKNTFAAGRNSKLPRGIYKRIGGKKNPRLSMLVGFEKAPRFRARLPYFKIVSGVVNSVFGKELKAAIDYALRNAK